MRNSVVVRRPSTCFISASLLLWASPFFFQPSYTALKSHHYLHAPRVHSLQHHLPARHPLASTRIYHKRVGGAHHVRSPEPRIPLPWRARLSGSISVQGGCSYREFQQQTCPRRTFSSSLASKATAAEKERLIWVCHVPRFETLPGGRPPEHESRSREGSRSGSWD